MATRLSLSKCHSGLTLFASGEGETNVSAKPAHIQSISQANPVPVANTSSQSAGTTVAPSDLAPPMADHEAHMETKLAEHKARMEADRAELEVRMEADRAEHEARMVEEMAAQEERMKEEVARHEAETEAY